MKKIAVLLIILLVSAIYSEKTLAQATRTWVSGVGDDVNPCSRTAPCKTFAGAIAKTAASGEIDVLDPGGFGAVNITKSITIDGNGVTGGVLSSLVNGIVINGPNIIVTIRNLTINGAGNGLNGIRILDAGQVHIENCKINGIASGGSGISIEHTNKGIIAIKNCTITGPTNVMNGISVKTTSATATDSVVAFIDNVHIQGVATAIIANEKSRVNVINSYLSNNAIAINPNIAGSIIRLSNNTIISNNIGIAVGAGKVFSFGNNQIIGSITSAPPTAVSSSQ